MIESMPGLKPEDRAWCSNADVAALRARVAELEAALAEVQDIAGNASISVETLAAFSPLTMIICKAADALGKQPSHSVSNEQEKKK